MVYIGYEVIILVRLTVPIDLKIIEKPVTDQQIITSDASDLF